MQSLSTPFAEQMQNDMRSSGRDRVKDILPLEAVSGDGGNLYRTSFSLLRAHEDKSFPGAFIASLSIPWGEAVGDENQGGYHLVWTRDLCEQRGRICVGRRRSHDAVAGADLSKRLSTRAWRLRAEFLD